MYNCTNLEVFVKGVLILLTRDDEALKDWGKLLDLHVGQFILDFVDDSQHQFRKSLDWSPGDDVVPSSDTIVEVYYVEEETDDHLTDPKKLRYIFSLDCLVHLWKVGLHLFGDHVGHEIVERHIGTIEKV